MESSLEQERLKDKQAVQRFFRLLVSKAWIIALATIIAALLSLVISQRITPYYASEATVLVNEAPATENADYTSVMMSERVAKTYAELMTKDPVLDEVEKQLGLTYKRADLKSFITVSPVTNTQLIRVSLESPDPVLSANIANTIVSVFVDQLAELQNQRFGQSKETLKVQLDELDSQIAVIEKQANEAVLPDRKEQLDNKVTQYRQIYASLLKSYEEIRLAEAQSVSTVTLVEAAQPDEQPIRPQKTQNAILGGLVGLVLSTGLILAADAYGVINTTSKPVRRGRRTDIAEQPTAYADNDHTAE